MNHDADSASRSGRPQTLSGVGYGRPPVEHRFRKGESGNPKGRPRKARAMANSLPSSMSDTFLTELSRTVTVTENGTTKQLSLREVVVRKYVANLVNASAQEQRLGLWLAVTIEQRAAEMRRAKFDEAVAYKQDHDAKRSRTQATPLPNLLPHPDDIVVDGVTLEVIYNGPRNDADKARWENALATATQAQSELPHLESERATATDPHLYDKPIRELKQYIAFVERTYPSERERRVPGFNLQAWRAQRTSEQKTRRRHENAERRSRHDE